MKKIIILSIALLFSVLGWLNSGITEEPKRKDMNNKDKNIETATFAGGCFWCVESDFEKADGVVSVISGYTGGHKDNPTYEEVCSGSTGHIEAVQVHYDTGKLSYGDVLDIFWRHIDPTDPGGQFVDRGSQYRTAVFYHNDAQKKAAEASKAALNESGRFSKPVVTEILALGTFYEAEEYHQDYYRKSPVRYKMYRSSSGRDQFTQKMWADDEKKQGRQGTPPKYIKPDDNVLKQKLTPLQYKVTQHEGTEPPFQNPYWDNKRS